MKYAEAIYVALVFIFTVVSCATAEVVDFPKELPIPFVTPAPVPHKYTVGQCFVVFDPKTGKSNPTDVVRVESIDSTRYIYRWRVYQAEWALDVNTGIGRFDLFESMTKEVPCPK